MKFTSGAKRSSRMVRYDLIPFCALHRLARRFTGEEVTNVPVNSDDRSTQFTGGALKYGEVNWMKGLPTSDVINHTEEHFRVWIEEFRNAIYLHGNNFSLIREHMVGVSQKDDHLAGAMWGLCVLMF